ncbi:MAG: TonB-dependent receptor [bacterium]|nr:TonB-dependent receptor [bacterium]
MTKTEWNAKHAGDRYFSDDPTKYLNETRPSINLGGPIIKDRLWFFGSWEKRNKWKPGAVYYTYTEWYNEQINETKQYYQGHYASAKLSANLGNHSLMAMWSEDPITIPNLYAYSGVSEVAPESDMDRTQGGWNGNGEWTSTLGANTYVVSRFAMKRGELNNEAHNQEPLYIKGDFYCNGAYAEYLTKREFEQYALNVSHFADTAIGYHDLKVGFEFLNIHNSKQENYTPGGEEITYGFDGVTEKERWVYTEKTGAAKKFNQMYTFFLQDKWEVTKGLTLNLGLRLESGVWKNHIKDEILKFGLGDMLAPRIGVAYQLGQNKINANWGRFYDAYGWELIDNSQPDIFQRTFDRYVGEYYTGQAGWEYDDTYVDQGGASNTTRADELKPQYMDEWGLGYERALGSKFSVSVNYLNRKWRNKISDLDIDPVTGEFDGDGALHFANVTDYHDQNESWGATFKKYQAVMVNVKKNLGDDKFQFMASYTYATLKGFFGASDTDTVDGGWGKNPYYYINRLGWLDNDVRHMLKFYGSVILPYDIILGTNFYWFSGMPYNETVKAFYEGTSSEYILNIDPKGSQRYPATWRFDVRLEKKFKFKDLFSASVYIDAFNILNNQVELVRNNNLGSGTFDGLNSDGSVNYSLTSPAPSYSRYVEWFPPMSFFLGAKIEW